MPYPQRLPIINSDDGQWGDILNQYLKKEHFDDGTNNPVNGGHQTVTIVAGTAGAGTAPIKFASGTLMTTAEAGAMEFLSDKLYFTITTGTVRRTVAIYDDSSGATGDIYYRTAGGSFNRLGVGASGEVLKVSGGLPSWGVVTSSTFSTSTKTTNYTIATSDTVVLADATAGVIVITLPVASTASGYRFFVKKIDSSANTVTITRSGADTIDGGTTAVISVQYTSITIVSNGTNWFII